MRVDPYKKAESMGIAIENLSKPEVIRAIQRQEGHSSCFGSLNQRCIYFNCCWRCDCLGLVGGVRAGFTFEVV